MLLTFEENTTLCSSAYMINIAKVPYIHGKLFWKGHHSCWKPLMFCLTRQTLVGTDRMLQYLGT